MPVRRVVEAGILGLLLGVGCCGCWWLVAMYETYNCGLMAHDELGRGLCQLNKTIFYPVVALVTAALSCWLTWAALAARRPPRWPYPVHAVPWLVIVAALTYHSVAAGKLLVATGMIGLGLALAALADQRRESHSAEPGC